MNWRHEVSEAWLESRKDVLTASDIKALIPEWKRIKKMDKMPDYIMPMFAGIWCEKNTVTKPDTVSVGSAARGHIMEPYAVESYNQWSDVKMYHWDDCIIKNNGLGFSPDAMDIKQLRDDVQCRVSDGGSRLVYDMTVGKTIKSGDRLEAPKKIIEIKSYLPDHHMKCLIKDKMDHDELWQIAVAFAVLPKLEEAKLMFFCPDAPYPVGLFTYSRKELQKKIDTCCDIASFYASQAMKLENLGLGKLKPVCSEEEIWRMEMTDADGVRLR